ncbi:MAG: hypothetical protein CMG84_13355 [Marinobacter sp.]|nr:hypothetical protein [Marinobacter sp.]|tara:strand:+ start:471 stop:824 length:354 start_codon:yes stop_codon:yes gene_type:complete
MTNELPKAVDRVFKHHHTEKPEELPPITVDIINHVSGLSNIVGHVTAIGGDARLMAWDGDGDYWVWLEVDEDNKFKVLVNLDAAPSLDDKVLNVIGYCGFHDIPYHIKHKGESDEDA